MKPIAIDAAELDHKLNEENTVLLDIREEYEYEDDHLDSLHIPMAEVKSRMNELSDYAQIVVCCKSGNRAKAISLMLSKSFENKNIRFLEGGIVAYRSFQNG